MKATNTDTHLNKNPHLNKDTQLNNKLSQLNNKNNTNNKNNKDTQLNISSNTKKRIILTIIMLTTFYFIIKSKFLTTILIFIIKYTSFTEIFLLKNSTTNPILTYLSYYYLLIFDLSYLHTYIIKNSNNNKNDISFICFILYFIGLIIFILNLKKYNLKSSFIRFALIHISIFILNFPANQALTLLNKNQFWFVYNIILVIINDIFAYIVGKNYGKTQLFVLSPKKTVEGFLGAWFFTTFFGYLIIYLKQKYNIFPESFIDFDSFFYFLDFKVYVIYVHCFFIILFASLCAPFGGFFASAYKRFMRVKDFSSYIPGHGGILDRMDCQFLMSSFMKLYYNAFILKSNNVSISSVGKKLCVRFSKDEILELVSVLLTEVCN